MTPKSAVSQAFRDAVLDLAEANEFARPFVNSGRLSTAVSYPNSPLSLPDRDEWLNGVAPGSPVMDAPLRNGWLLQNLSGNWALLSGAPIDDAPLPVIVLDKDTALGRYELSNGGAYLIRPDQYVAARWKHFQLEDLEATAWRI
jgi:3-(3-hydroxy-phenyl)propionate hydroxylase